MKKAILGALCGVLCSLSLATPVEAQVKIATINMSRVFDSYWKRNQADAQLRERKADFEKQSKGLFEAYQKANEEYQKLLDGANDQAVATEERDKRKRAAEDKLRSIKELEAQITQFNRTAQTTIGEQTRRMRDAIVRDIQEVTSSKAKASGFNFVFDASAVTVFNTPILVYNANENDLSDEVLKQLNAQAPAEFLKPLDTGASAFGSTNTAPR